jgi:hypothetical protein
MFSRFLAAHASGQTDEMLARALEVLVLAVEETGQPGRMHVAITVRPKFGGRVEVGCEVTVKPPL